MSMSLSPIARTEVRSKLAQIPIKRPRLERQANESLLEEIQADCLGEPWTKTPSHQLSDDQLQIVLRIIIESVSIHRTWTAPYQGDSHKQLYETICGMPKSTAACSHMLRVIQSHGSGKSRMVDEMAELVFTIPVNLQNDRYDEIGPHYPPPDKSIRDVLLQTFEEPTRQQIRYHTFFGSLFAATKSEIDRIVAEKPEMTYTELTHRWRMYLRAECASGRDEFYERVVRDMKLEEESLSREAVEEAAKRTESSGEDCIRRQVPEENKSADELQLDLTYYRTTDHLDNLLESLRSVRDDTKPKRSVDFIISFDESQELSRRQIDSSPPKSLYDVLCSVLNIYVHTPFFILFLSSVPHVSRKAQPSGGRLFSSARWVPHVSLHAPILKMPFDCSPRLPIAPREHTLQEISRIEFMAQFGRAIFWAMLHGRTGQELNDMSTRVINLARSMLLGLPGYRPRTARLAVVDVRLCLEYSRQNSQLALETQGELVMHHMRTIDSYPEHQLWFLSGFASEPIVAEAATRELNDWRQSESAVLINVLDEYMGSGILDAGERTRLVARALITEAYDRATLRCKKTNDSTLASGCGVIDFVEELYKEHREITESFPDNIQSGTPFREAFQHARLRITHWVRVKDGHELNTERMAAAFIRGFAFICSCGSDDPFVDLVAPVLLWDVKIGEYAMSAIFWTVKPRKTSESRQISVEDFGFFPSLWKADSPTGSTSTEDKAKRPYITIVMDLSSPQSLVTDKARNATESPVSIPPTSAVRDTVFQPGGRASPVKPSATTLPATETGHPRYAICTLGCSDTVFAIIDPVHRETYERILHQDNSELEEPIEPPCTSERPTSLVDAKPAWSVQWEGSAWYDSPVLNKRSIVEAGKVESNVL
ncbi:uncharacterized protein STEHIDRAFT_172882 [Stereum hirsutum FP-91666 SS1]|uniref:Uncharacterized protein n=1 Tax=Stereum hirsutum (strain FP-91666) TaxID=721885 RepID=R7S119_STEHR|nr:uncharacterized protein STEHIDRAFT_172882 [Stereum hirsutum FP-91666 SS1]EIM80252.1 hypothetical protein STEHIDRAFT_172882 [Stereum hirsutum FP-91666 SS1]